MMASEPESFSEPEARTAEGRVRFAGLDVLRGLAAFVVMIHHCIQIFPQMYPVRPADEMGRLALLTHSPLHFFWAGDEAVILFFVLSGFVLALPFLENRKVDYAAFIVKRILRIYLPHIAALAVAVGMMIWISPSLPVDGLSRLFNRPWSVLMKSEMFKQIFLVGDIRASLYNPVIWSLRIEMQASIIFPLIVLLSTRLRPGIVFLLMAFFAMLGALWWRVRLPFFGDVRLLFYLPGFMMGVILASRREVLCRAWLGLRPAARRLLIWTAAAGTCIRWYYAEGNQTLGPLLAVEKLVVVLCVSVFIVAAMASANKGWLSWKPLVRLGHISYSLYLYHVIVLLSLAHTLYGKVPLWGIGLMTVVISLCIASVSYDIVEVPAVRLGRKAAARLRPAGFPQARPLIQG